MRKLGLVLVLICAIAGLSIAQPTFWGTSGLMRTVSADNHGKGFLIIGAHGNYYQKGLTQQIQAGTPTEYTQRHADGYLSAAFSPLSFLEVSGGISGLLVSDEGVYGADPTQFGFGDAFTGMKLSYSPWWWVTVGGHGYVTWPTGSAILKDSLFTSQEASHAGLGLLTFDLTSPRARFPLPLRFHMNFGYLVGHSITDIFERENVPEEPEFDDQYLVRAGVEIPAGHFNLFCDFSTEQSTDENIDFRDNPMRITPGVRFVSEMSSATFGVDIGIGNKGAQDVRHIEKMDWKINWGLAFMTRLIQEPPRVIYAPITGSVVDADKGTPLVASITSDDTTMTAPFVTKEDGIYRFFLQQGAHNVTFTAPEYETITRSVVIVDSSGIALDVALRPLVTYGTLTGKVTDAVTGAIVAGTVTFREEGLPTFIIDPETGVFTGQMPTGNYTLIIETEDYHRASEVVVIEKDRTLQKDIQLRPLVTETDGKVAGNITDANTGEGLVASINIEAPGFTPIMSEHITGRYEVTLPAGTWSISVSKDGYHTASQTVVVKVSETTVQSFTLRPIPMSTVTGKVTNTKDGSPLSATITFPDTDIPPVQANESGIYRIRVNPGTYEIRAEFEGFIPQSFPIVAEADKSVIRDFELVKAGEKITLDGIFFDFDKATIKPESRPALDRAIKIMTDNPGIRVRIEGHTDSMGAASYNMQLSQRRADSVKAYLVQNGGIDASRIIAVGRGEDEPIASNDTEEGRSINRRIEFIVLE
ncbi:MAG TPA: PEGA domain-containing protein [candidate division Zixibacteria bacterium]|nr:PEGA domain-containing protein [candidate division Zixibacteria bacterium]